MAENRTLATERIKSSLREIERHTVQLRRTHLRLVLASVFSSGVTTLVAGITAAQGPIVGSGPSGWRLSCIVAAGFAFVSAVSVGLSQQLHLSDRLSTAHQVLGRLRFLDVAIDTGNRSWETIMEEYADIVKTFPDTLL
jgi:hypothetical protein